MKKILFIAILLATGFSSAQIKLSGVVKDSIGEPLEMANVVAIDTVAKRIAAFGFTDAKGFYKLEVKQNTVYNLRISYVGMKTSETFIKTADVDIEKNVILAYDNSLDEITIVSKMPVTIKGDTIVYNADSFKNGSERKLEDVLKNIPGVEINADGEIEVEGKKVQKLLVEGKDFFDGDSKIATKNIPSNAVDKIQVLRNFGEVNQLKGVQNNQDNIAINIKLKEGKKNFWFGDVTAGAGDAPNESLYLFQPKLFYYSPKYSINVIGDINNIGEKALSNRDIRNFGGGFSSPSASNGTNISLGNNSLNFLSANNTNANKIETKFTALNFSYSPNPKLDLSGFLIYSNNRNGMQRNVTENYVDPNTPDDFTQSITKQNSDIALFKFSSIYRKNVNNQMDYDIIAKFSKENQTQMVNSRVLSDISQLDQSSPYSINQNLSYYYTADENNIFALNVQHLLQDEDPFYNATLENDPNNNNDVDRDGFDDAAASLGLIRDNDFYRLDQRRKVKTNQLDAKLDWYNILNKKSNLNFVFGTIYSKQNFDSRFYQILDDGSVFNPTPNIPGIVDPQTTNDTEYTFVDVYGGIRYRLKSGMFTFTPGLTTHAYIAKNTQYNSETFKNQFTRLLPEFNVIMQLKQSENIRFSYAMRTNFTDVNQIARGIVANNYNSFFSGTPSLVNATSHNLSLNYFSFNLFNYTNIFARIAYSKTIDQIRTDVNFQPGSVVSSRTSLNSPFEDETLSASARVQKTFSKFRGSVGANLTYAKFYQFLNTNENTNETFTQSFNTSLGTNFRKAPNFDLRYNITLQDQNNSARPNTTKAVTHSPSINFDAYIWDAVTFRTNYSYNEVRQNGRMINSFRIWDATLAYRKNKDAKWEYEVKATNLLGTGSRVNAGFNNVLFSISETFILPRFVSFRVRYQL